MTCAWRIPLLATILAFALPAAAEDEGPSDAEEAEEAIEQVPAEPEDHEVEISLGHDEDVDDDSKEDVVLIGQSKTVGADETVTGDVVIVGGNLTILGTVRGDAVCVGGSLEVGPTAVVRGDLVNVGGTSQIDPAARIKGDRVNVIGVPLGPMKHLKHLDHFDHDGGHKGGGFSGRLVAFISEIVFFLFLVFLALLATVFMPRQLGRIDDHLAGDFPRSALLGLAAMVLLPLAVIILAVTIVGIPLIPLVLLAVAVTCLMGYIAFGKILGRKLVGDRSVMVQITAGLALLEAASVLGDLIALPGGSFTLVAHIFGFIGTLIFIGASFIGLGAVVYSRWGKKTLAQTHADRAPNGSNGTPTPPAP